jgi:molybdate transport system permease protein
MPDPSPLLLTLKLAGITTILLFALGLPIALWLAYSTFRFKPLAEAVVSMPLVLPPTVLGFYLLLLFSQKGIIGGPLYRLFDVSLVFSFGGLVVASMIYSLPFMVHPLQSGLQSLPASLREASYTLGKSPFSTLFRVLLPNMKSSVLSAIVLTFAHTIGEFGVVLMIGGNIPGSTKVASIVIYDEVQSLNYHNANVYSLILFVVTFSILLVVYLLNRKSLDPL